MAQPSRPFLKRIAVGLVVATTLGAGVLAHAQTASTPPPATSPSIGLPLVEAEVRKIDQSAGKITLKHGDIPNLDMPPMTMVFQVRDPAQLGALKPGDKIRFTADKINGAYTAIDLERAP